MPARADRGTAGGGDADAGASAEQVARRFERANERLIAVAEALSEADWARTLVGEGWPIGVAVHHVAEVHGVVIGLVDAVVAGRGLPAATWADFHRGNAEHAREHADCARDETLRRLREASRTAAARIRQLDDAQLEAEAPLAWWGDAVLTAEQLIEVHMTGHAAHHRRNVESALQA
jgi:uncharacterized damage-inducible protein DinB